MFKFNIEDFDDFREQMLGSRDYGIMTGELPETATAEEINAVADESSQALEHNSSAIYALLPADDYLDAASLALHLVHTLGGVKLTITAEVTNVGSDDSPFFCSRCAV